MRHYLRSGAILLSSILLASAFLVLVFPAGVQAEEMDCAMCHPKKAEGDSVHPAIFMGCACCHTNVNAQELPHDFGDTPYGLMAEGQALCVMCHDSAVFNKSTNHMTDAGGM